MRTRRERIKNTWKKIRKRLDILKYKWSISYNEDYFISQPHRLAKDKFESRYTNPHTNNKTKRHIHGNYQPTKNYSRSDKQKLDKLNYLKENNYEEI